jgi:transcriptional regulator with XRE-family HTH domain
MTSKQAAVIFELLKGESQQQVAAKMKKSKSTINQRVSAGRWPEIEKLLQQYENIINQIT